MFFVSNTVYLIAVYLSKTVELSLRTRLGVSLALSITNTIFFFWILKALEITKKSLLEKNQMVKYQMMRRFTWMLLFVYLSGGATVVGEVWLKMQAANSEYWRHQWLIEASWQLIFTTFLVMVMILMRPSERSKLLAYVEELGETDRVTQGGSSVHNNNNGGGNQTFESESAVPPSQSAQKQEQSIEMQEM